MPGGFPARLLNCWRLRLGESFKNDGARRNSHRREETRTLQPPAFAPATDRFGAASPPTTNHQPPTTNHQPPTTNHQPPTTNHQPPTTNH
jgi:hypothetical protein